MISTGRLHVFCAALFALPLFLGAQSALPAARQQEIEKLVAMEMSRQNIPGLSVAVAVGGELAWSAGYGFADLENFVPAKAQTMFRLASISQGVFKRNLDGIGSAEPSTDNSGARILAETALAVLDR